MASATTVPIAIVAETIRELQSRHPDSIDLAARGVLAVAARWNDTDGDTSTFAAFCLEHFQPDPHERNRLHQRLETALVTVHGHLRELRRTLRRWSDLRGDDYQGLDDLLALFDPAPDLSEQWYTQKLGLIARLNAPPRPLDELLAQGSSLSTRDWVATRIGSSFGPRTPRELNERARAVSHTASTWVDKFQIAVGPLVTADGHRPFEPTRRLIAHWHVRDRLKAAYGDLEHGLATQRALAHVMGHHIHGTVPRALLDDTPEATWNPVTNTLDGKNPGPLIDLDRYHQWIAQFQLAREFDALDAEYPTAIARRFARDREIPDDHAESLLTNLLDAPVRAEAHAAVARKLGRPLESHDIYAQELQAAIDPAELDARVRERFGDIHGFQQALPDLLRELGFAGNDADFLAANIQVEVCKGAGHASPPALPEYHSWMRTSSLENELGWDGFDTAMHELGHNLEQVISCHFAPSPLLRGVPNTACTEAFAFLYQYQARRVLGLGDAHPLQHAEHLLDACEIAGPSLVELRTWRWLYENPDADAAALRDTVLRIADEVWIRWYEPHLGPDPHRLMAAYQHMIAYPLYLADYAIGHIISHQITSHVEQTGDLAGETRRICAIGSLTPDAWMHEAVGAPISIDPLLRDAAACLAP